MGNCQAGTEALELVEGLSRRIKYGRLWTTLATTIILALGTSIGAWIANAPAAKAEQMAVRVATDVARSEVQKAQKTTEDISYAAAKLGSNDSLQAFYASLSTAPIVKPKSAPAKQ